jgi:GrpB-like predicted nucleotidyltransferase (UPF0157 family)
MNNVRLMHYDPRWTQEFRQTRSSVLQSCLGLVAQVEHIGSTAISGLIARPTIDVMAVLGKQHQGNCDTLAEAADLIEGLNFRRITATSSNAALASNESPGSVDPPECFHQSITLEKPRHGEATHRLFLMSDENQAWKNAIAIRFEETKVARWRSQQGDQSSYEASKAIFFTHLIDQICT